MPLLASRDDRQRVLRLGAVPWSLRQHAAPAAAPSPRNCRPTRGRASVDLANAPVLVYQPQVNKWDGNQLDFRAALAIQAGRARRTETFGVIFATARTQVDKVARTVVFENLQDHEDRFSDAARPRRRVLGRAADDVRRTDVRTISLDRLRGLARRGRHQAADGRSQQQRRRR